MKTTATQWFQRSAALTLVGSLLLATAPVSEGNPPEDAEIQEGTLVQLAILLDTSSSMSGLVRQAQTQIWKIVNEFATTKESGRAIRLQVALYEYGKNTLPKEDRYIRQIVPLTNDLDRVSEELFALRANHISGGDEYAGATIQRAVKDLGWEPGLNQLKVIVVAGNESFAQGPVNYKEACRGAVSDGIIINTIYCGDYRSGVSLGWKEGADLADGVYGNINQNLVTRYQEAPQDAELLRLGDALNETYVPFGTTGREGWKRQTAQDKKAFRAGKSVQVERAISKGSGLYKNETWDLVDAIAEDKVSLEELDAAQLPQEIRKLDRDEQVNFLKAKATRRKELRSDIAELRKQRSRYLAVQADDKVVPAQRGLLAQESITLAAPSPAVANSVPAPAAAAPRVPGRAGVSTQTAVQAESRTRSSRAPVAFQPAAGLTLEQVLTGALRKQAKTKGIDLEEEATEPKEESKKAAETEDPKSGDDDKTEDKEKKKSTEESTDPTEEDPAKES